MKPHLNGSGNSICEAVVDTLDKYFQDLEGEKPDGVYDMVIRCIERPMLEYVLQHTQGNQSAAAELLGINRNTLRRKLVDHQLL